MKLEADEIRPEDECQFRNEMAESSGDTINKCGLCFQNAARYTCPKCLVHYCSLTCYKSEQHGSCSENFYKKCVEEELQAREKDKGDKESRQKMEEILVRLAEQEEAMDSDDLDDSDEDLEERMKNVDLDSPDEVWNNLTENEKREFQELIESGKITEILPPFEPWWITESIPLIQEMDANNKESLKIPPIKDTIASLSSLMSKKPSDNVVFGLMNILYGYCAVTRLFMSELDEDGSALKAIETMLKISTSLSMGQNFDCATDAVEYARVAACSEANVSVELCPVIKSDVARIMKHKTFILSALSHIHGLIHKSKKLGMPKRETFFAMKKVEFYLSYVTEFGDRFNV